MLKEALALARLGFAVFPLAPNTKMPTKGSSGVKDATTDSGAIKRLFTTVGKPFNIGIALGQISGIVCIDLDRNHGATDDDLKRVPRTVTVKTRNGYHVYYKITRPCKKGALWGGKNEGDNTAPAYLRADGQYVVGPSSTVTWNEELKQHLAPWDYEFHADAGGCLSFQECELAYLPEWAYRDGGEAAPLSSGQQPPATGATAECPSTKPLARPGHDAKTIVEHGQPNTELDHRTAATYEPGLRHDCFVRTAVSMRKRGKSIEDIRRALLQRNQTDFTIPKENAEEEIKKICAWVEKEIKPLVVFEVEQTKRLTETGEIEYLQALGHLDDDYYYTSNSNRQITKISSSSHTLAKLLTLQPLDFWMRLYPKTKDGEVVGCNITLASSELMEACRLRGIYSDQKIRGAGCWSDKQRLVYHNGSELVVSGQVLDLNGLTDSEYLYTLRPSIAGESNLPRPLTMAECQTLTDACQAISWKNPHSAILFAGGLALARLCGALAWRPHIWLTGPMGCGKSSVLDYIVAPIFGHCGLNIQGETTAAGIRQRLESDSKPVLFDEAETNNDRSSKRMQHVLELARQASYENEGQILKGTADGSGHSYKITSMFLLASVRVNLIEETDKSRFAQLDIGIGDPAEWPNIKKKLSAVTKDFGDRLHARMIRLWPVLQRNVEIFQDAVAARYDRRTGQQYGTLLAGWFSLTNDGVVSEAQAKEMVSIVPIESSIETQSADEKDCVDWLSTHAVTYDFEDRRITETYGNLINKASRDKLLTEVLPRFGLGVSTTHLFIATQHSALQEVYSHTKWGTLFHQSLVRLPGAERVRHKFGNSRVRAVSIPFTSFLTFE